MKIATSPSPTENSKRSVPSVPEQLTPEQLAEARRIAGELVKLRDAGAISSPNDSEAVFFAHFLVVLGGLEDLQEKQRKLHAQHERPNRKIVNN